MDLNAYMQKHGISDADLDEISAPYEQGDWTGGTGETQHGSHLGSVGKKRVTVVYDARDALAAKNIARDRGVTPSEIYREALKSYLATA